MSSTIKTLVKTLLSLLIFTAAALAVDTSYKTRIVKSAALTIKVKDGQFVTIRSFTQDIDVGQRGVVVAGVPAPTASPTPTPTPTPTPVATPSSTDLTATKTDDASGHASFPNAWTWKIHVANNGGTAGTFSLFDIILTDNLPNNITYGPVSVMNAVNVTNSGSINCSIAGSDLSCFATGSVTIGAGGSFDVSFTATPNSAGNYFNPRTGGVCSVDPNNSVSESDNTNNACADTVVSSAPMTVSGTILTASISYTNNSTLTEFIKPITVAGPATLTIEPIPGATLAITYRKGLQESQPTPTP